LVIRVGTAGWAYPDWEGVVYPRAKGAGFQALRYLAGYVGCVELNGTFYGDPRAEHAERWLECVRERPDFRFTAKLQRAFTHEALPRSDAELADRVARFHQGLEPLRSAGRLAALLVQFPLSFRCDRAGYERLERLAPLLAGWRPVLEVRHRSWFEPDPLHSLAALGFSLACIDLPSASDHPPPDADALACASSAGPGYLRLHGRNAAAWFDPRAGRDRRYDYLYGPDEIAEIARTARRIALGRDETYVITNNHFSGKALANALELLSELGEKPSAPPELVQAFPRLAPLVRASGQGTLFP
jgi:uncharacterized protein YecE (DUF72 family)